MRTHYRAAQDTEAIITPIRRTEEDNFGETVRESRGHVSKVISAHSSEIQHCIIMHRFRWVQCQLDEIVACKRHVDIEAALDNLPAGLYETYDRVIQAIKQRGRSDEQIAQNCLF
jgi:hypothetical protein